MLNLVVAVILENFTSLGNVNEDLVSTNDIIEFKEVWGWFDPDADGMIPAKSLPHLVKSLPPPLGVKDTKNDTDSKAFRFCLSLGLTQQAGEVPFRQVLDALIHRNYAEKQVKLDAGGSNGAVKEVLLERGKSVSAISVEKLTKNPGKIAEPLTARRFEMSRILAEELLRMFIKRKRDTWERDPAATATPPPPTKGASKPKAAAAVSTAPSAAPNGKPAASAPKVSAPPPPSMGAKGVANGASKTAAPKPPAKGKNPSPPPPRKK